MLVLGIESSCDETGFALVDSGKRILANCVVSQDLHNQYGGVVPELASRMQLEACPALLQQALGQAGLSLNQIDLIAVTKGPGLIGSLLVGLHFAKGLAWSLGKPLVGVNHVEAHLYAPFMGTRQPQLPAIGVAISGGHTALFYIEELGRYALLGQTRDDAIGEAFDKSASLLGLPYPGGHHLEAWAKGADPFRFPFTQPHVKKKDLALSFSGLKTAFLYHLHGQNGKKKGTSLLSKEETRHLAASFQYAAFHHLLDKIDKAVKTTSCKSVIFGGGVSGNQFLRHMCLQRIHLPLFWPPPGLSQDNGAMIAGLAYHQFLKNRSDEISCLEAFPTGLTGLPGVIPIPIPLQELDLGNAKDPAIE